MEPPLRMRLDFGIFRIDFNILLRVLLKRVSQSPYREQDYGSAKPGLALRMATAHFISTSVTLSIIFISCFATVLSTLGK